MTPDSSRTTVGPAAQTTSAGTPPSAPAAKDSRRLRDRLPGGGRSFGAAAGIVAATVLLFIVSEMTVPGLRHAKQLVEAIRERLGDGPKPQVIVNRFEQQMFSSGLRKNDIEQVLGDAFAACIPNHYAIVREAIDRGVPLEEVKPGNKITMALKKVILPQADAKTATEEKGLGRFKLSWAR